MSRRLARTPGQLRSLLEVLTPFGFTPAKVEVAQDGAFILYGDIAVSEPAHDPLMTWEDTRARRRPH